MTLFMYYKSIYVYYNMLISASLRYNINCIQTYKYIYTNINRISVTLYFKHL